MLSKIADWLDVIIRPSVWLLLRIALIAIAVMMFLTAADVLLRYVFNKPIMGAYDMTEFMMGIVAAFTIAYCAFKKGHLRVDILIERLPQRAQELLNAVTTILGFGLFVLIVWQTFIFTKNQFDMHITSSVIQVPRYPFAAAIAIGLALFTLVMLSKFFRYLSGGPKK